MARGSSSTLRALACAWAAVAAVVALAWFLKPEGEAPRSQVDARYERQRGPRPPRVDLEPGAVAAEPAAEAAPITSAGEAEIAAIASWHAQRPKGTGRIFGTVTARETGRPIAGVEVVVKGESSWYWWTSERSTGPDGAYEVVGLPADICQVMARSAEADVLEQHPATTHLPEGGERRVDLAVAMGGRVWGTVLDERGRPVQDARVILGTTDSIVSQMASLAAAGRPPLHARTDERGDYVVQGVPFEQEWVVWFDHDRQAPVLSPSFVLHETRPQLRIDVTLLAGTRITGRVVEPSGRPVADAKVLCVPGYGAFLSPMRRAPTVREERSETDGSFALAALPAGEYQLFAFKDGHRIALKGLPVYPDGRNPIADVELVLRPVMDGDRAIFGVVTDTAGVPIAGAHVALAAVGVESMSVGGKDLTTGDDGAFRFQGVGEGLVMLTAGKAGYRPRALENVPLDRRVVVTLEREATISGVVLLPGGTPAPAFTVRVVRSTPASGTPGAPGSAPASLLASLEVLESARPFRDAAGRFQLGVPPGRVLLEAQAPDHAPGRLEVDLPRGSAVEDVVLRLPEVGATIRGRVTTPGGAPIEGATVSVVELGAAGSVGLLTLVERQRSRRPAATTDARGSFELASLASATYQVVAEHPRFARATLLGVTTAAGQTQDVALVLTGGGTIVGKAKPGVMITVAGDGFSAMMAADEAGSCRFERVPAGAYLVRAVVSEAQQALTAPEVHRRSVRVDEGGTTTVALLEDAPQVRTVTGRVQPAPREGALAMVLVRLPGSPPPDPADLIFQGALGVSDPETSRYVVAEGLVAADGTYALPGVPPGRYTLDVYVTSLLGSLAGEQATLQQRKEIHVE